MVRNKNIGGGLFRSSMHKTKKTGSQIAGSKDLTPLEKPADDDIPAVSPELQTTSQGQLGFPDRVYLLASVIFQKNHMKKPAAHRLVNYGKERGLSLPEVKDEQMQRTSYELAFNTLKYQDLLEDILIDSCFYLTQPMPDDQMSLVAVMLYDFQDRNFFPRECQREDLIVQEVRDVESYLLRFKTKLAASLARCRIKHDLLSIECILPESVKMKQERSSSLPLYAWINTQRSSLDEVRSVLKCAGFSQVKSIGQLEDQTFCQDPHCGDLLVFPAQLKAQLYTTKLLSDHKLILQDKSCNLGPNAVCSLLPEEGDVLMVGFFSGLTVSHTASLIAEKHKANSNDQPTVYICVSDRTNAEREELQQTATAMGCKNVKLIPEDFQSLNGGDKRLQRVRVVLLTPKCSVSAVSDPVNFILQEKGDTELLQDLSQGSISQSRLEALVAQQMREIDHALKFPKVLAVVYSTCSSYREENEEVVNRALEQAKARSEQEGEPKQANFRLSPSPFSIPDHAKAPEETDPFFMLEPSEQSNGCFLAVLSREPEPVVKEAPHDVLVRANAKGILDRIGSKKPTRKEQHGHTNRMTKTTHARTSQSHLSVSIRSKNQETKGSNSTTLCGHQEFTNSRQSLQGKAKAVRLQSSQNTVSSSFSSSKPENSATKKSIPPVLSTTTSTTTLHPVPPPAFPAAPVVRPRRAHQEVLKPVVLVLPTVRFPDFFPPLHSRPGRSPSFTYNKWRPAVQSVPPSRSSGSLSKDAMVKSQPLF
ncbi:putative methyltransferase NSUN7 isoform X1 [Etheostoma cragini]|uniref:putative methyltransferase NSUN7 isoform X1 n=2 Tax=Etheostoma cragini TaxID=417921 RepID=UPI00155DEA6C|nr:putative methyltransferase NSUN7 isoform X1 [Etheostoma cragini]XP_034739001.1 putative methyltransferase NSUN7 isoform X1 [Etheostoma cragini]